MRKAAALLLLLALALPAQAQGLFDDNEARRRIDQLRKEVDAIQRALDERMAKVEAQAAERRALLELSGQIDQLRNDLARMRGQVELLLHQADTAEKRQKDLYLDIDTRLRKLEQAQGIGASPDKPAPEAQASPAETKAYEAALNQFKLGNYKGAIAAFQGFLATTPQSPLAPSAQYWIGNAHYAQRDYKGAIAAQLKVLSSWPDNPKAADAMLNIASSQEAMGDRRSARKTLEGLVAKFPSSPAAESARQRLQKR